MELSNIPFVGAPIRLQLDDVRIQQVIGRAVIAMFILDAEE